MLNKSGGTGTNVVIGLVLLGAGIFLGVELSGGGGGKGCPGWLSTTPDNVLRTDQYSNDALAADVYLFTYDGRGELDHPMFEVGATSSSAELSIDRLAGGGHRKVTCFDNHPTVIAKLWGRTAFNPLHVTGGNEINYFVVWHDTKDPDPKTAFHAAMLSMTQRSPLDKFRYEAHWHSGGAPSDPDASTAPAPGELVQRFQDCWSKGRPTWRACFGEVQKPTAVIGATGFGLGISPWQGSDGSVPWVACAQAGCCCGGTGCHTDE